MFDTKIHLCLYVCVPKHLSAPFGDAARLPVVSREQIAEIVRKARLPSDESNRLKTAIRKAALDLLGDLVLPAMLAEIDGFALKLRGDILASQNLQAEDGEKSEHVVATLLRRIREVLVLRLGSAVFDRLAEFLKNMRNEPPTERKGQPCEWLLEQFPEIKALLGRGRAMTWPRLVQELAQRGVGADKLALFHTKAQTPEPKNTLNDRLFDFYSCFSPRRLGQFIEEEQAARGERGIPTSQITARARAAHALLIRYGDPEMRRRHRPPEEVWKQVDELAVLCERDAQRAMAELQSRQPRLLTLTGSKDDAGLAAFLLRHGLPLVLASELSATAAAAWAKEERKMFAEPSEAGNRASG